MLYLGFLSSGIDGTEDFDEYLVLVFHVFADGDQGSGYGVSVFRGQVGVQHGTDVHPEAPVHVEAVLFLAIIDFLDFWVFFAVAFGGCQGFAVRHVLICQEEQIRWE